MPARPKTSDAAVIAAATCLLETAGPEAVTMGRLAAAVGVRGPSLYKRFRDRAAVLAAVELAFLDEIAAVLAGAGGETPRCRLEAQARDYRAFARRHPQTYALIYSPSAARDPEHDAARAASVEAALVPMREIVGPERALSALRTLTAFLHGWISVEAAALFRLGGDVDRDFDAALATILEGIEAGARAAVTSASDGDGVAPRCPPEPNPKA